MKKSNLSNEQTEKILTSFGTNSLMVPIPWIDYFLKGDNATDCIALLLLYLHETQFEEIKNPPSISKIQKKLTWELSRTKKAKKELEEFLIYWGNI